MRRPSMGMQWACRKRLLESLAARGLAAGLFAAACVFAGIQIGTRVSAAQGDPENYEHDPKALIAAYKHVEVASVSDAIEQLMHQKMYLSHKMQPLFPTRFAGYALTVRLKKEENDDPRALDGMLAAIDQGDKDSVYVMSIEDGADIAG